MQTELTEKLSSLVQLDIDAVNAYEQAINNIDHTMIRTSLLQFQEDHKRHIVDLSHAIRELGGYPPERTLDIKGFFIKGFTAIRSLTGTEGALKAMMSNEKLTTSTYENALTIQAPAAIKEIIQRNYADEQRHLEYITTALNNKTWENAA